MRRTYLKAFILYLADPKSPAQGLANRMSFKFLLALPGTLTLKLSKLPEESRYKKIVSRPGIRKARTHPIIRSWQQIDDRSPEHRRTSGFGFLSPQFHIRGTKFWLEGLRFSNPSERKRARETTDLWNEPPKQSQA